MAGISSKAAGVLENKKNKFQNQEFDDDLGINYYEFKWRNHDPQIGRFIEIDPLADKYVYNSTYAFSENKVTNHVELEGLEACESFALRNEKRLFSGEQTEAQYSANIKAQATGGLVAGGVVFSLMFPAIASPIIAADVFGFPSPTAPTSVATAVVSEAKTVATSEETIAGNIGKSRNAPASEGIPNSSKIEAKDIAGKTTKYSTYDENGNLVKQVEADRGTSRHGIEGATKKIPTTNTLPDGTKIPGKMKIEPASPNEIPQGKNAKKLNQ